MKTAQPAFDDLESFRFRGGRLCLDFAATVGWRRRPVPVERLGVPERLADWLADRGLAEEATVPTGEELVAARALREAIYRLVQTARRGEAMAAEDLDIVNAAAATPDPAPQLDAAGRAVWKVDPAPVAAALSCVARDAVRLIAEVPHERIKECAR
ncbi:MAG: ABATE domain-containing protein, partial [Microbacterium sp.]